MSAITRLSGPTAAAGPAGAAILPDPGQAALVLLAYTVVFVALALWRFRARDVTSG